MFVRLIRAVRRKPKAVRDQYALWIAICFTAVVVFFWIMSFSGDVSLVNETPADESVSENRGSLSDIVGELRDGFNELGSDQQAASTTDNTTGADDTVVSGTGSTTAATQPTVPIASQPEVRIATFSATSASTAQ